MGDVRFERAFDALRTAPDRRAVLDRLSDETLVAALTVAAHESPYLANVVATEAMNRVRRKRVVLETIAEGVVELDPAGTVRYANRAVESVLGWSAEDLQGRCFHDVVRHRRIDHADTALFERAERLGIEDCDLLRPIRTRRTERGEDHDVFVRRDGRPLIVSFTSAPVVHDGEVEAVVVVFRDNTPEREEEDRLRFFETATEHAPVAVFWVDRDARIVYANGKAAGSTGRERDDIVGRTVFDVDAHMRPERWREHWERVRREGTVHMDTDHRRPDGGTVPLRLHIQHLEQFGREYHLTYALPREP